MTTEQAAELISVLRIINMTGLGMCFWLGVIGVVAAIGRIERS